MRAHRSTLPLVAVLALVVGYLAGLVRGGSEAGEAKAGPTIVSPNQFAPNLSYTSSEDGRTLYSWRFQHGLPVAATSYSLQARTSDTGQDVMIPREYPMLTTPTPR